MKNRLMRDPDGDNHRSAGLEPTYHSSSNVGRFRFWFIGQRWEWSDELFRMHGYEPGTVDPTTELLLAHKHPDDRAHVADLLDRALHSGDSFSSRHRFLDTAGDMHDVLVIADRMLDDDGSVVVGTAGYYVDLTRRLDETRNETVDAELPELLERRAVIEQAKGILMYAYRLSEEQAFKLLRWRSQETNVKLRALAAEFVAQATLLASGSPHSSTQLDRLLMTVHERLDAPSTFQSDADATKPAAREGMQ